MISVIYRTGNVERHLGRILAVYVTYYEFVCALIVRLGLPHAEGDRIGLRIREKLEPSTFDDLGHALVEFESWRRVALHPDGNISRRVWSGGWKTNLFDK